MYTQPSFTGNGNHNIRELEAMCAGFKEFCYQEQLKIQDLEQKLSIYKDMRNELVELVDGKNRVIKSQQEWMDYYFDQMRKLEVFIEMVEDNTKMPHQHKDYYERLCCLSERASEALAESRGMKKHEVKA